MLGIKYALLKLILNKIERTKGLSALIVSICIKNLMSWMMYQTNKVLKSILKAMFNLTERSLGTYQINSLLDLKTLALFK